jgi:hypothetical protein
LARKSSKRPGLTSYLKIASTVIVPPSCACPDSTSDKGHSQPERRASDQNVTRRAAPSASHHDISP